jgi:hypothetical protein
LLALAPASLAAAGTTGSAPAAPRLLAAGPTPAVAGLPLVLTVRSIAASAVHAVLFAPAPLARRSVHRLKAVLANHHGALTERNAGVLSLQLPALPPGAWEVSLDLGGRHGRTGAVPVRVAPASSLQAGARCPAAWIGSHTGGLVCTGGPGGARWRPLRAGAAAPTSPVDSSTTTSTTSTTVPPVTTSTAPAGPAAGAGSSAETMTVSTTGDPSRGATSGTVQAVLSDGGRPVSPAAGSITFSLASLDPYQSAGTLELTTTSAGQTSCSISYRQVYVEQEDPSALGAPDGWRGEVAAGGDCRAAESPVATTGRGASGASGASGAAVQPFLTGLAVSAAYTGTPPASSATDDVRFSGPVDVATTIVRESTGQPGCASGSCLLVWPSSSGYVGEVIAGRLSVRSYGPAPCSTAQLYDGPLPGVAALSPVTVSVPEGCSGLSASYTPPSGPVAGEGGEAIGYQPAAQSSFAFAGGTTVTLAAGAAYSYPPAVP